MLHFITTLDRDVTAYIASLLPHNAFFNSIFSFLSLQGLTIIIWIVLFAFFVYRERFDNTHRQFIIAFAISFLTTSFLVNIVIKNIVMRERPWVVQQISETICPDDFSFPSGHAAGAFAGAIIFAHFDRKRNWLYYGIAGLISLSRIYLQCHYFLDVMTGALIGFLMGWATLWLFTHRNII